MLRPLCTLGLIACSGGPQDSGEIRTTEGPYCEQSETPLGWEEPSPLGASPAEALAPAEGRHDSPLSYEGGGSTQLVQEVGRGAEQPAWVESVAVYPGDGASPAIGILCEPYLSLPIDWQFTTEDGAFAERWSQRAQWSGGELELYAILPPEELDGSWTADPTTVPNQEEYTRTELAVDARFAEEVSGSISLRGETIADDVASLETVPIASWGSSEEG